MSSSGRGNARYCWSLNGLLRQRLLEQLQLAIEELQRDVTDVGFNQSTHHNMRTSEHSFADGSEE